jgi:outer membrane protein assembly factor BamA
MKFSEETVSHASYWLYKSGLFTKRPEWEIFKDVSGYGLNYKISEKKYNELLFLGGYSSSGAESDYSVLAQIKLGNIFGSMRRAAVLWDRSGGAYEKLRLSYREPFILSFPLSTEIEFSQAYRKHLSLTRRLKAAQSYELDLNYSLNYGWSGEKVYPDSLYSGRLNEIVTKKYYAGMEYSTIHDRNPIPEHSGWRMHGLLSSVEIDIKDSTDSNGLEAFSEIELIHALRENVILNAKLSYNQVFFKNDIPDFNRIDFGGALSFRGYREDFFASDIYLKQSADLFFVAGTKDIAFNVFSDFCQYNEGEGNIQKPSGLTFLRSYGGGIIYESGFGQMQILLGIPEKEGFIQSVVHVKYSVRF